MSATKDALVEAVEALYPLFARHRIGNLVEGCPCCVDPREGRALATTPMRALPDDLVGRYASSALYTWGTEEDFLHLLPVILDRIVFHRAPVVPQVVFGKLRALPLSAAERAALEELMRRWLRHEIALSTSPDEAWWCEEVFECAGMSLAPLLDVLDGATRAPSPNGLAVLTSFASHLGVRERFPFSWWKEGAPELAAWLRQHARERLEAGFLALSDHPHARAWSDALDLLTFSP